MIEPASASWQKNITAKLTPVPLSGIAVTDSHIQQKAKSTAVKLKAIANKNRLIILSCLYDGSKSVGEICDFLNMRQPAVSQNLARLRADDVVGTRRAGKNVYYFIRKDNSVVTEMVLQTLLAEMVLPTKQI